MKAFINSSSIISPQDTFYGAFPINEVRSYTGQFSAIEPQYKDFINPMKLRRMNRMVRMGLTTALACLKEGGIEKPDGIISATGWGCLADTFDFLDEIRDKKEEGLSPATFIQSTHNTIGGQIALAIDCQEYNSVIVNHTTSFEHGLIEAMLLLAEGKESVLAGGLDEISKQDIELKRQAGFWKESATVNLSLFKSDTNGTIAGEGSAYFLLGNKKSAVCTSQIDEVFFHAGDSPFKTVSDRYQSDLIISGFNGDKRVMRGYPEFAKQSDENTIICIYKHLCGEYDTSSAFALWLADKLIKTQNIPKYLLIDGVIKQPKQINRIIIHHFSEPDQHAFIVVSKAGA